MTPTVGHVREQEQRASAITPMRITTLTDQCYMQLKDAIISLEIQPGSPLSEIQLATRFGISKSPVREALQRLSRDGLVTLEPNRRCVVTTLDISDVRDWYELRLILEPASFRQVASDIDREQLDFLREVNDLAMHSCEQLDLHGFIHNSDRFHLTLVEMNKNRSLVDVVHDLFNKVRRVRVALYQRDRFDFTHSFTQQGLARHDQIIDLLGQGASAEAVSLLQRDIQTFFEYLNSGEVADALDRVTFKPSNG